MLDVVFEIIMAVITLCYVTAAVAAAVVSCVAGVATNYVVVEG